MKSKKALMGLAAILILIFHFYIPVTSFQFETLLARIAYIGVDIFFFVSAYSLGKSKIDDYFGFLKKRFSKIYFRFMVFTLIAIIFTGMKWLRAVKILTGYEFFLKGGGSFLWFVIAILLTYLLLPWAKKLKERLGLKTFWMLLGLWAIVAFVLQYLFHYTTIFIFINRWPIILIGLFYDEIKDKCFRTGIIADTALLAFGMVILFKFGATTRLAIPFKDMFYIIAIPAVLAIVNILEYVCDRVSLPILSWIGTFTLELYGLQMIFGYKMEAAIQKTVGNGLLTFLLTAVLLSAMAYLLNRSFGLLEGRKRK